MKTAALGVTNLTDARYFAAMGVDWIGFDLSLDSPLTLEHILAFSEWVEGPKLLLDVRGRTVDEIAHFLSEFEAEALLIDNNMKLDVYHGKVARMNQSPGDDNDADISISAIPADETDGIEKWWVVNSPDQLSADVPDCTIAVTGGDEDKVGVKNYDLLDAIFERLELLQDN